MPAAAVSIVVELANLDEYQITKYEKSTSVFDKLFFGKNDNELFSKTSFGLRA